MKRPLIILTGPTAVGKTVFVYPACESNWRRDYFCRLNAGISIYGHRICQDPERRNGWCASLSGRCIEARRRISMLSGFRKWAKEAMEKDLCKQSYSSRCRRHRDSTFRHFLYDIDFTESDSDASYRSELECYANEHGVNTLHENWCAIDPNLVDSIHANNVKRVIRALEYYHLTGEKDIRTQCQRTGKKNST